MKRRWARAFHVLPGERPAGRGVPALQQWIAFALRRRLLGNGFLHFGRDDSVGRRRCVGSSFGTRRVAGRGDLGRRRAPALRETATERRGGKTPHPLAPSRRAGRGGRPTAGRTAVRPYGTADGHGCRLKPAVPGTAGPCARGGGWVAAGMPLPRAEEGLWQQATEATSNNTIQSLCYRNGRLAQACQPYRTATADRLGTCPTKNGQRGWECLSYRERRTAEGGVACSWGIEEVGKSVGLRLTGR